MTSDDAGLLKAAGDQAQEAGRRAEAKWGVARLPLLVPLEWAAKFEAELAAFDATLRQAYADGEARPLTEEARSGVLRGAGRVSRAWSTLDRLATESGAQPLFPDVWEAVGRDGQVVCVVRTTAEACALVREGRTTAVYTMEEVANVIAALPRAISDAKVYFPGATVARVSSQGRSKGSMDDMIPF